MGISCLICFVLLLITFIYLSTWYCVVLPWEWWTTSWGLFNIMLGHALLSLLITNYLKTSTTCPGRVPKGWIPNDATAEELQKAIEHEEQLRKQKRSRVRVWGKSTVVRYCAKCEEFKPPRTHHCSDCGHCTLKMDHHCPWVGNCVGLRNHKYFVSFVFYAVLSLSHTAAIFIAGLVDLVSSIDFGKNRRYRDSDIGLPPPSPGDFSSGGRELSIPVVPLSLATLNLIIVLPIVLSLACLLIYQLNLICENTTTIEEYERKFLKKRAKEQGKQKFRWHYDLGWAENCRQVFGNRVSEWFLPYQVTPHNGQSGLCFLTHDKEDV